MGTDKAKYAKISSTLTDCYVLANHIQEVGGMLRCTREIDGRAREATATQKHSLFRYGWSEANARHTVLGVL